MKKLLLFVLIGFASISLTNAQSWVFAEQFSSTGDVTPVDIKVDGNGDVYIIGNYEQPLTIGGLAPLAYTGADEDIFLCKFTDQGVAQWAVRIGGDDKELVALANNGDVSAFESLYRRHRDRIYGLMFFIG